MKKFQTKAKNVLNIMNARCCIKRINNSFLFVWLQSLTLLEYLLKTGSDRIPKQSQENIHIIKPLVEYRFTDKDGKDQVPAQVSVFTEGSGCSLISQETCTIRRYLI